MKALSKQEFNLPYLGADKFKALTKMGLGYNRGTFFIKDINNVENVKDALANMLDEKIVFTQTCFVCGENFLCLTCKYYIYCLSRDLPFYCICKKCSRHKDLYEKYVEKGISRW